MSFPENGAVSETSVECACRSEKGRIGKEMSVSKSGHGNNRFAFQPAFAMQGGWNRARSSGEFHALGRKMRISAEKDEIFLLRN